MFTEYVWEERAGGALLPVNRIAAVAGWEFLNCGSSLTASQRGDSVTQGVETGGVGWCCLAPDTGKEE